VVGAVNLTFCPVFGDRAFDDAGAAAVAAFGQWVGQDSAADHPDQVDDGAGDDAGGVDDLVSGCEERDGETGPARTPLPPPAPCATPNRKRRPQPP
jgi:hypothetical protein